MREVLSILIFLVGFFVFLEIATDPAPSFNVNAILIGSLIGAGVFTSLGIAAGILGAGQLANVIAATGIVLALMVFLNTKLIVVSNLPIILAIPISAIIATMIIYTLIRVMK